MTNQNLLSSLNYLKNSGVHVVQLLNCQAEPTAALYLDHLDVNTFAVSETGTSEKYYMYINGVGIFFTSYKVGR